MTHETLLIVGASARAAAQSAIRGGLRVVCADLFADADVRRLGEAIRISRYPDDIPSIAHACGATAAMYTGGLENHPRVLDKLAATCTLLGNSGQAVREVRDPLRLQTVFREDGRMWPRTTMDACRAGPGRWLRKPLRSCGGSRISLVQAPIAQPERGTYYYQDYVDGVPHAGSYLAAHGRSVLLGVTRQLIGCDWLGSTGFAYCGSIGPLRVPKHQWQQWERIGECLAQRFQLRGLFGVDVIVATDGIWPIEVNPRYTASMELIERMTSVPLVPLHVGACLEGTLPSIVRREHQERPIGKAILYADTDLTVTSKLAEHVEACNLDQTWPIVADIPQVGNRVQSGRPVLTMFANGKDQVEVELALRRRIAAMRSLLAEIESPASPS